MRNLPRTYRESAETLYYIKHNTLLHHHYFVNIGKKGGGDWVISTTFPTLGYEYMTLTCASTSCI